MSEETAFNDYMKAMDNLVGNLYRSTQEKPSPAIIITGHTDEVFTTYDLTDGQLVFPHMISDLATLVKINESDLTEDETKNLKKCLERPGFLDK